MYPFKIIFMAIMIAFLPVNSAFSESSIDSYIITFTDTAGLVESSGQSKEALAQELGLDGEIVSIFETINAILVKVDAEEADRLSQDERVLTVEKDGQVTALLNNEDNDYPTFSFQDGILRIPRVDTDRQAGNFQDAVFKIEQDGTWHLLAFTTTNITEQSMGLEIDNVEMITTNSSPVQIFLKLTGVFSNGCGEFGQINQRLKDNLFEVTVHAAPIPVGRVCTAMLVSFEKIIPLHVFGLPAGDYAFSVNGGFDGVFTLTEENGL